MPGESAPDRFFEFRDFDDEIAAKLDSLERAPSRVMQGLTTTLEALGVDAAAIARLDRLFVRLDALPFDAMYPNYLTHPIRVVASFARIRAGACYDELGLCLCHNVREAGLAEAVGSDPSLLPAEMMANVDLLTIDRTFERDRVYLDEFYDRLEHAPTDLLTLKALDKLDNTLWWPRFEIEPWDADVVLEQVCPRLRKRNGRLATYLEGLTHHALAPATRRKFLAPG